MPLVTRQYLSLMGSSSTVCVLVSLSRCHCARYSCCLCLDQRGTKPEIDWETYRKSWFEVKIHPSSLSGGEGERNTDTAPSSLQSGGSPYYMDYKDEERQGWWIPS